MLFVLRAYWLSFMQAITFSMLTSSSSRVSIFFCTLHSSSNPINKNLKGLYPFHPQPVQNLHQRDSAMRLEFCYWLHTNRQLLPLILFTDEATFTRNGKGVGLRNATALRALLVPEGKKYCSSWAYSRSDKEVSCRHHTDTSSAYFTRKVAKHEFLST